MENRMSVAQALNERDFLVSRIYDKIRKASFADTRKANEESVLKNQIPKEKFEQRAGRDFQQILELIERYQKIDAAIVTSNAVTYVEAAGEKFSVAVALSLRDRLRGVGFYEEDADFEGMLCRKMEEEYGNCRREAEKENEALRDRANQLHMNILSGQNRLQKGETFEALMKFVRENRVILADPLDIQSRTEYILEKRRHLLAELDTQIKLSNAATFITV